MGRDLTLPHFDSYEEFQSTRPRGARPLQPSTVPKRVVSIHAPTWGATLTNRKDEQFQLFQSTRPRGARLFADCIVINRAMFQSTRPRGARRVHLKKPIIDESFNPRAHVGRDLFYLGLTNFNRVSIHAPTWGATDGLFASLVIMDVSIHAPTWGATGFGEYQDKELEFQSTRPRGARLQSHNRCRALLCFNPRAHVGRDIFLILRPSTILFQSTRPRGARL